MSCLSLCRWRLSNACLVRMTEQIPNSAVMTLDSDFKIYGKHQNEVIEVILPWFGYRNFVCRVLKKKLRSHGRI
jgi:hypothetical protein